MALKRSEIPRPVLPAEAVDVPEIGGEVIVRGLMLSQRLDLGVKYKGAGMRQMSAMLALCVVDADGVAVFTEDEWEAFGAGNFDAVLRLSGVAQRLSGFGKDEAGK